MNVPHMKEFYDIYGIWHIPWWQRPWVTNALIALCIIAALIFFVYVVKKIKGRKKKLSAWEIANRDLTALMLSDRINIHESKSFYMQLTNIIKQYLYNRYGFDIYGKTDREILSFLDEQITFPRDLIPVLHDIFEHAGQIKFANISGIVEQMEQDIALSLRLIKETMPTQPQ